LITFDDGDYSVLQNGIPILMKYKMPSVLFIITELIGSRRAFWWDRIRKNMNEKGISQKEIVKAIDFAKKSDNQKRIEFLSTFDELESRQLTESELMILEEEKMSICNHSHTHPMFDRCSAEEIENELTNTRAFFEKLGVGQFEFFAYPNGNNDEVSRSLLEKKGVKLAFLFDHQLNKKKIDALSISRIRMNSDTSMQEFKIRLSGTHSYFLNKRNQLSRFKSIFK
jgi:peptidoglycan/xylan/chitin deacetylase (PgdA/CDA1 family)